MSSPISVVIPTYNGAAVIGAALDSIFAQSLLPREIVVVDDLSSDETLDIVESRAAMAPVPLRSIRLSQNSGGPGRPLNVGIAEASGDFICILEQDDLMRAHRIEKQLQAIGENPDCSLVIGRFSFIGSEDGDMSPMWPVRQFAGVADDIGAEVETFTLDPRAAFTVLLNRNFSGSNSNFCFSKRSWKMLGGFTESVRTCTDLDFVLKAVLAGPVVVVNDVLVDLANSADSLHRLQVAQSQAESTMVRLRAASKKPEWAGEELNVLRHASISFALGEIRDGDFSRVRELLEIFSKHKGMQTVGKSINKKTRRLIGFPRQ